MPLKQLSAPTGKKELAALLWAAKAGGECAPTTAAPQNAARFKSRSVPGLNTKLRMVIYPPSTKYDEERHADAVRKTAFFQ